ncbi:uncharacterized protein LOC141651944 [Silene latifolia]|uniref:uncharacterized protein LOC141651944 n=1 Tax=Silene latifolia TaxID=37657 RepID=UPI003D76EE81
MVVADLLAAGGGGWDNSKVRSIFLPIDQQRILNMRVGRAETEDIWLWDLERNGEYSVKSAYKALVGLGEGDEGSSDRTTEKRLWNQIWSMRILPCVKIFFWQFCCEAIAGEGVSGSGLPELDNREAEKFVVGIWAVWEARNEAVFEGKEVHVGKVVARVLYLLKEMEESEVVVVGKGDKQDERTGFRRDGKEAKWQKPRQGIVKINVDAGVKEGEGMGIGVICRDEEGVIKWGWAERRRGEFDAQVAEVEAMLIGLQWAKRRLVREVCMEGDCKALIEALKHRQALRSEFHAIIEEILSLCHFFKSCTWSSSSRKSNTVAHELAHLCKVGGSLLFDD